MALERLMPIRRLDISNLRMGKLITYLTSLLIIVTLIYGVPFIGNKLNFSDMMKEESEQESRIRIMSSFCGGQNKISTKLSKNILVSHRHQTLYCFVPNTGSTFWKRKFIENSARGRHFEGDPNEVHDSQVLQSFGLRILSELSPQQQDYIGDEYFKFVFFRHPITRLVSTFIEFNSKIPHDRSIQNIRDFILQFDAGIHNPTLNLTKVNSDSKTKVTFGQFVKFVTRYKGKHIPPTFSNHWRTYDELCNPCYINYDFIGLHEEFGRDTRTLMKDIFNETEYDLTDYSDSDTNLMVAKIFVAELTNHSKKMLISKYDNDMNMLGFSWQEVLTTHNEY